MMSSTLAEKRVNDFKNKYGEVALQLAYHAALPVALNADLLHLLRINFFLDPPTALPYTAEFELLLSPLCREIDEGLYEIEPEIRDILLQGLCSIDNGQRIKDVATLLWQYIDREAVWIDRVELERAQQLTVLNFLDPAQAKDYLAEGDAAIDDGKITERDWYVAMRQEIDRHPQSTELEEIDRAEEIRQDFYREMLERHLDELKENIEGDFIHHNYKLSFGLHPREIDELNIDEVNIHDVTNVNITNISKSVDTDDISAVFEVSAEIVFSAEFTVLNHEMFIREVHQDDGYPTTTQYIPNQSVNVTVSVYAEILDDRDDELEIDRIDLIVQEPILVNYQDAIPSTPQDLIPSDLKELIGREEDIRIEILDSLSPRERDVIRLRCGLDDGRGKTLSEIGQIFNVTRGRIRQIEAKALAKLRHPDRLKNYIVTSDGISQKFDYNHLRYCLAAREWRDADIETTRIMLAIIGEEEGKRFDETKLLNFPCADLQIIDRLWLENSNGRFGFSVQKRIYAEISGGEINKNGWDEFSKRVGWRDSNSINYDTEAGWIRSTTYDNSAPVGHIPVLGVGDIEGYKKSIRTMGLLSQDWFIRECMIIPLFNRMESCMESTSNRENHNTTTKPIRNKKQIDPTKLKKIQDSIFTIRANRTDSEKIIALEILGINATSNEEAIQAILFLMRINKNNDVITEAVKSLVKIGKKDTSVLQEMVRILRSSSNNLVIIEALTSLGKIGNTDPKTIRAILHLLALNRNSSVIINIMKTFALIAKGNNEVIQKILSLLPNNNDTNVKKSMIESLGEIASGNKIAINQLISILRFSPNAPILKQFAANSLGKIAVGDKAAISAMESELKFSSIKAVKDRVAVNLNKIDPGNKVAADYRAKTRKTRSTKK